MAKAERGGEAWTVGVLFSRTGVTAVIEETQLRYADRLDKLILVMALYVAVSTGQAVHHPTPSEKKPERQSSPAVEDAIAFWIGG